MDNDYRRVFMSPLLPSFDISEFVSKLDPVDIRARFGRFLDAARVASLLVPERSGLCVLGAWREGSLVGTAMIAGVGKRRCELALLIRSDMKRRGIGALLIDRAFAVAREFGADEMIAQASADNVAALRLLQATGFRSIGGPALEMGFAANLNMSGNASSFRRSCYLC